MSKSNSKSVPWETFLSANQHRERQVLNGRHKHKDTIYVRLGALSECSAYIEYCNTKIFAVCAGPKELGHDDKNAFSADANSSGRLQVLVRVCAFACGVRIEPVEQRGAHRGEQQFSDREQELASLLRTALAPCIRLDQYARSVIEMHVTVIEDDGFALPAAITCASAALVHAKIELHDILAASMTLISANGDLDSVPSDKNIIDQQQIVNKEQPIARLCVALMPNLNQVGLCHQIGRPISAQLSTEALQSSKSSCALVAAVLRKAIRQHVKTAEDLSTKSNKQTLPVSESQTETATTADMSNVLFGDDMAGSRPTLSAGLVHRRQRSYYRKTKTGGVVKVVREHYLRSDIGCGLRGCELCGVFGSPTVDIVNNKDTNQLCPQTHVLMLDTNILLHKADALEDDLFRNVILPQTVWEEVKKRSPPAYKKMYNWVYNEARGWHVFMNELHQDTYCTHEHMESGNDKNDRAIRQTLAFYQSHVKEALPGVHVKFLLLTDDVGNKEAAVAAGLQACSLLEYVQALHCAPTTLIEKAAARPNTNHTIIARGQTLFPEHLSQSDLQEGIKAGKYKQGAFQVSRENYLEGYVYLDAEAESEPVFVQGLLNCNRAVHNDLVVIQMLPKEQWSCPARLLKIRDIEESASAERSDQNKDKNEVTNEKADDEYDKGDELNENEDTELMQSIQHKQKAELLPTARIVGIAVRKWRQYCGVLLASSIPGARRHLFSPAERRVPRIRIETRQADILKGQRIMVAIDSWPRDSRYPVGHYVRSLGVLGDRATENEVLLLEHDVPHTKFSKEVLDCLPALPWEITDLDRERREDLRHLTICSVDPPGCTDIDDALHCRMLPDGNYEVGVHIADVSHFVRAGTCMDREAAHRSTTVYLCDQRIDMLPELLSGNLCSLRGGVERFAFSVIWTLTPDACTLNTRFHKSIIRSAAALTYEQAQTRIDDTQCDDPVNLGLRGLNRLAKKLRQTRKGNGALSLASMEIRFNLDSETRDPISVQEKKALETNSMVEEFMLLANIAVADKIHQEYPDCAVLRRHPKPAEANYKPAQLAAAKRGFELVIDSGKALADSLDRAVIPGNPFFNTMLRMLTTRCMTQAVYFASGTLDQSLYYHFGLASPIYTHFTSPIRRYADLMVHRLLAAAIAADDTRAAMLDKRRVQEQCQNMNYRHKQAQYAGRASVLLNTHLYFKEKKEQLEGYVLNIRRNAIQVLIPRYGLESAIPLGTNSPFDYDEEKHTLTAHVDGSPVVLHMFDKITVQISLASSSDGQHHRLRLDLVEPQCGDFSVEPIMSAGEPSAERPLN